MLILLPRKSIRYNIFSSFLSKKNIIGDFELILYLPSEIYSLSYIKRRLDGIFHRYHSWRHCSLESRMRIMVVLLRRMMNDERNNNVLLDIVSKEDLSDNIWDVGYMLDVLKPWIRRQIEHLVDYMLILARNIKKEEKAS